MSVTRKEAQSAYVTIEKEELDYWAQSAFRFTCALLEAEAAIRRHNPEAALPRLEAARGVAWRLKRAMVRAGAVDPVEAALREAHRKVALDRPEGEEAELTLEEGPSALAGKRIVLADSAADIEMPLRIILTEAGLQVVGAAQTPEEAVKLTLQERPDILLLDIDMSGISSLEIARQARNVYPVCVVVMAAHIDLEHRRQDWEADICAYLSKPVGEDIFLLQLEQAFAAFEFSNRLDDFEEEGKKIRRNTGGVFLRSVSSPSVTHLVTKED